MSLSSLNFFNSGNQRLIGKDSLCENWQSCILEIDRFLQTSTSLTLKNNDVVLEVIGEQFKVFREVTGFAPRSELINSGLIVKDLVDRPAASLNLNLPYAVNLKELNELAKNKIIELQSVEFPKDYGDLCYWQVRLGCDFKSIDSLNTVWKLYSVFDHSSSSILTF